MSELREVLATPIAHRGLHDRSNGVIENSPTAFRLAIEQGCAIECDLQLSGDGVPMVIHDNTLDRVTDQSGSVYALSAGQIGNVPLSGSKDADCTLRFAEMLELVAGRVALAVELKPQSEGRDAELARAVVAALRSYEGPVALISFSPHLLRFVRKFGFKGPLGIITGRFVDEDSRRQLDFQQRFVLRHLLHYPWTRFDFVDCDHKALDLLAVRLFRALGFPLACWTIRSEIEARQALKHSDQITFEGYTPARV